MHTLSLALQGGWKVLLAGLLLGAGLPTVFAVGIRSLAWGAGGTADIAPSRPNPAGKVLAAVCFALVLAGIAMGIAIVVASGFGRAVSFAHIFPTFVTKK